MVNYFLLTMISNVGNMLSLTFIIHYKSIQNHPSVHLGSVGVYGCAKWHMLSMGMHVD